MKKNVKMSKSTCFKGRTLLNLLPLYILSNFIRNHHTDYEIDWTIISCLNVRPCKRVSFKKTRMKTSIISKAFCSITDRQTDKIFTEQILIYEENLHKKNGAISQLGAEKITFPPKPDGHTDILTDGHLLLQSSFATKNRVAVL